MHLKFNKNINIKSEIKKKNCKFLQLNNQKYNKSWTNITPLSCITIAAQGMRAMCSATEKWQNDGATRELTYFGHF